jgi:hypothetical protein
MTSSTLMLNTAMTALIALAVPVQLSAQTLITFDPPNSTNTQANAITQSGEITGYFCDSIGCHGFLRAAKGTFTSFDPLGSTFTYPNSITQSGEITGFYNDASFVTHGFLRAAKGTITTFDATAASNYTNATSINLGGMITGYWGVAGAFGPTSCFLRTNGTITTFNPNGASASYCLAINNDGVIAGYYLDASSTSHGFVRDVDGAITTIDAPGAGTNFGLGTAANAINQAGTVTGWYTDSTYTSHGFLRTADGTLTTFDPPNSQNTYPGSINPAGEIAGYFCDSMACHGFLRSADGTFTTIDAPNTSNTFAFANNNQLPVGINPGGVIAGNYFDVSGFFFVSHGFVWIP